MKGIRVVFWLHLLVAVAGLGTGYALRGLWAVGLAFGLVAALWAFAQPKGRWRWFSPGGSLFFLFVAGALLGVFAGIPAWSGLLAVTAALGAWDLDHFLRRLAGAHKVERLARAHLRHLLAVEVVSAAAGLLALNARLRLPFWWEALLVALVVIGMTQVIRQLRAQAGEEPVDEAPPEGEPADEESLA